MAFSFPLLEFGVMVAKSSPADFFDRVADLRVCSSEDRNLLKGLEVVSGDEMEEDVDGCWWERDVVAGAIGNGPDTETVDFDQIAAMGPGHSCSSNNGISMDVLDAKEGQNEPENWVERAERKKETHQARRNV